MGSYLIIYFNIEGTSANIADLEIPSMIKLVLYTLISYTACLDIHIVPNLPSVEMCHKYKGVDCVM